ncbi:MAG: hypothetical protein KF901_24305 [Myxococcales bacterium]|nr:hypothetical protein [Myxococcales bacterium]
MIAALRISLLTLAVGALGCAEYHRVEVDAARPDAPAPLELCRRSVVRCMVPFSDLACPEAVPNAGTSCTPNGIECHYCPGGTYDVGGSQVRSCIGGRWSSNRQSCTD